MPDWIVPLLTVVAPMLTAVLGYVTATHQVRRQARIDARRDQAAQTTGLVGEQKALWEAVTLVQANLTTEIKRQDAEIGALRVSLVGTERGLVACERRALAFATALQAHGIGVSLFDAGPTPFGDGAPPTPSGTR